jgi:hypothetical protein
MSRPQFERPQQQQLVPAQNVVNGGLIDFQDNYNRGVCEYPTPHQIMAAAAAAGYTFPPGVAMPASLAPQQAALAALNQHYQQHSQQQAHLFPNSTSSQGTPQTSASAASMASPPQVPGTYISGPPTFLHVNGVTYKPVEELATTQAAPASTSVKPSGVERDSELVGTSAGPGTKMLTERDLHHAIDNRVQSKVESYLSTRRVPVYSSMECHEGESSKAIRHMNSTRQRKGASGKFQWKGGNRSGNWRTGEELSAEELAAERVQDLNDSMRSSAGGRARYISHDDDALMRDW